MPLSSRSSALAFAAALALGCVPARTVPQPGASAAAPAAAPTLAASPDRFFLSENASLRYRDLGRGEPIVLLHGYARSLEGWTGFADSLAAAHRVIALDVRGFGRSAKSADPAHYAASLLAGDVARLLDHLGLRRAHVVGHSMGAVVAAQVAARHPDRVATATLVAGPFFPDPGASTTFFAPWIEALERGEGLRSFIAWNYPALTDSAAGAASEGRMAQNDLGSLIAVFRAFPGLTLPRSLTRGVRAPTLVIVGTEDRLAGYSRQLAAEWPGARLVEVVGADHGSVLAHPRLLAEVRALASRPSAQR